MRIKETLGALALVMAMGCAQLPPSVPGASEVEPAQTKDQMVPVGMRLVELNLTCVGPIAYANDGKRTFEVWRCTTGEMVLRPVTVAERPEPSEE